MQRLVQFIVLSLVFSFLKYLTYDLMQKEACKHDLSLTG